MARRAAANHARRGRVRVLPPRLLGLRHVAIRVRKMAKARAFYEGLLGFRLVWSPDPDSVYLTSGMDNLALHQMPPRAAGLARAAGQVLDHLGLLVGSPRAVDTLARTLSRAGVAVLKPPRRHRDGSYSFYMADPDRNVIQVLYEPTLSRQRLV